MPRLQWKPSELMPQRPLAVLCAVLPLLEAAVSTNAPVEAAARLEVPMAQKHEPATAAITNRYRCPTQQSIEQPNLLARHLPKDILKPKFCFRC